jgi:predicted helicase
MQLKEFLITIDHRGRDFEDVVAWFLLNDPVYRQQVKHTWLWRDWPGCWGRVGLLAGIAPFPTVISSRLVRR